MTVRDRRRVLSLNQNWIDAIKASRDKSPMPIATRRRPNSLDRLTPGLHGNTPAPDGPGSSPGLERACSSASQGLAVAVAAAAAVASPGPSASPSPCVSSPSAPTVSGHIPCSRPRSLATAHSPLRAQRQTSGAGLILRRSQRKIAPLKELGSRSMATPQAPPDLGNHRSGLTVDTSQAGCSVAALGQTNRRRAKPSRVPNVPYRHPAHSSLQPPSKHTASGSSKSLAARASRCPSPTAGLRRPFSNLTLSSPRCQDPAPGSHSLPHFISTSSDQTGQPFAFSDQAPSPTFFFHFPPPTPSRHPPPIYPGHRPASPPSIHRPPSLPHSRHNFHQPYPAHFSQQRQPNAITTFAPHLPPTTPYCSTSRVRRPLSLADRTDNLSKTKKRKLCHLHFRSALLVLSNLPFTLIRMPIGTTPDSRLKATSPCFIPPSHVPRWFASSDIPEGRTSRLCLNEGQQTGTGQGWQAHPAGGKVFYPAGRPGATPPLASTSSSRITDLLAPSSVIRHPGTPGNAYDQQRMLPARPAIITQAGPQKAHLLAILRMRSNMAPGGASLRFKKWVLWNAWTRREQHQLAFQRPLTIPVIIQVPKAQVEAQAWTGNEVFDENGDMVTSESTVSEEHEEGEEQEAERAQTIILVSGHPTPPQSPVEDPGVPTVTLRAVAGTEARKPEQEDDRPPTPPPSPPNGPSLSVMGCHA